MRNQAILNKESVLGALRAKAEQLLARDSQKNDSEVSHEVAMLLNELEIYELELQMQNEELKGSYNLLETERRKFAQLFNAAPVGYLILTRGGYIAEINRTGEALLLGDHTVIKGKKLEAFILSDSLHEYRAFLQKIQQSTDRIQCEVRLRTKVMETKYVQLDGITVPSAAESEPKQYITITDVTNAKKAQQHLWETTERLNQTLKVSLTGTWMIKSRGKEVFLDEYSRDILEIGSSDDVNDLKSLAALVMEEDRQKLDKMLSNCDQDWEIDMELRLAKTAGRTKTILVKGKSVRPIYGQSYLAGIMTDISDRKRSLEIAEEYEKNQRRLLRKAAIEAEEKERAKISAALHDSVCQILYGIRFNLNHLNKKELAPFKLDHVNLMLDQAINELRTLSVELTPSILKDFGFKAGINDMVQQLSKVGFKVHATVDDAADKLPAETQLYCFRIIQELLNNSIKHSGTSEATVRFDIRENVFCIHVHDKGKGFQLDVEEALKQGSGLRGIKNRVSILNGNLEISNDNGTNFKICFSDTNQ